MKDPVFMLLYHACLVLMYPVFLLIVTVAWLPPPSQSWIQVYMDYWRGDI
jgi:hypothetical protein